MATGARDFRLYLGRAWEENGPGVGSVCSDFPGLVSAVLPVVGNLSRLPDSPGVSSC